MQNEDEAKKPDADNVPSEDIVQANLSLQTLSEKKQVYLEKTEIFKPPNSQSNIDEIKKAGNFEDNFSAPEEGNTAVVMAILSEMWIVNLIAILGGTYCMTFILPQYYVKSF